MNNLKIFVLALVLVSCSEKDDIQPIENPDIDKLRSSYGIDGLNQQYLSDIALLGDGISGINGISWDDIEPNAPQNDVHDYQLQTEMMVLNRELEAVNRKLQLNFRLASHWALDRDPTNQVTNPEDGSKEDGILGVKPSHEKDLADVIRFILNHLEVEVLQVGSEAENEWLSGDAYVRALSIIYQAAKEVQPDITVMVFGFNPANYFTQPQNFNEALVQEKLDFAETVIRKGEAWYDVFSFHASREFEAIPPTFDWIKAQMEASGYVKPIWVDDMYSGPWLDPNAGTASEKELFDRLLVGNPQAIAEFDSLQAGYMVKKITSSFKAGIEKVFVSSDVDFDSYYIPNWRYAGLIKSSGVQKPAYHNLKLLIEKTDGFEGVQNVHNHLYEFTFSDKKPIYIYWNESDRPEDLSVLHSNSFTIHQFVYKVNDTPISSVVTDINGYTFGAKPTLIELND
ncbi:MAG: hypothetical protein AAFR66_01445 [Bacteroidota bacterium]